MIHTADAATALRQSSTAASMTLSRLVTAGLVSSVRHGMWWLDGAIDSYRLPEHLTAPLDSYLSLHTALHLRGLIEQIPEVLCAVTLGRTQRVKTRAGAFSFHHVAPEVFGRSRLFTTLPKLELPRRFRKSGLRHWLERIPRFAVGSVPRPGAEVARQPMRARTSSRP